MGNRVEFVESSAESSWFNDSDWDGSHLPPEHHADILVRLVIQSSWRESAGRRLEWLAQLALCAGVIFLPLVINPASPDVFVGPKLALMVFLTVGGAIAAGIAQILGRPTVPVGLPDMMAMILAIWATAAWLLSIEPGTSLLGEPTQRAGLVSMLVLVGAFGTARVVATSTTRLIGLLVTTSVAATAVAVYGLIQLAGIDPIWQSVSPGRAFSFIGQPNWLGAYLAITIPVTGSLLSVAARPVAKLAIAASVLAQLALMIGTLSRAGWVGILVGAFAGTLAALLGRGGTRRHGRAIAVFVLFVLSTGLAALSVGAASKSFDVRSLTDRFESIVDISSFEARERLALWEVALAMTGEKPWFGSGPDTYAVLFPEFRDSNIAAYYAEHLAEFRPESSHNAYLDLSVGLGVPGLMAFVALLISAGFRLVRELGDTGAKGALSLGILIGLIGHSFAIAFMSIHVVSAWILWSLLGAALTTLDSDARQALA